MKIPIIIPEKNDDQPITLSLPKLAKLDKLAKVLISSGIGLALAGAISTLLDDDSKPEVKTSDEDAQ
ncbi:MAG: hypothetical protein IKR81_07405 [Victivallales bacterium]|nr:hypothetical protein [Victivallales bacterium]